MRVKRGKFETNNYSLIVLKCLDDDGQKRPEDIKKVKENVMLCFCKDENENNFEIYVNAER